MRFLVILIAFVSIGARASVLPYAEDTLPKLIERADIIAQVNSTELEFEGAAGKCMSLRATVSSALKGNTEGTIILRGSYQPSRDVRSLCSTSGECTALEGALLFVVKGEDPTCPGEPNTVLSVLPTDSSSLDLVELTIAYLTGSDKLVWAEQLLATFKNDEFAVRSAMAVTISRPPSNSAVQRIMRTIVLDDSLDTEVRLEAVRLLSATDSPAETAILRDLNMRRETSVELRRQSLPYLNNNEAAQTLLAELSRQPEYKVAPESIDLLKRFEATEILTKSFGGHVEAEAAFGIRKAQLENLLFSHLSTGAKTEAMKGVLETTPNPLGASLIDAIMPFANTAGQKKILVTLLEEETIQ